MLHFSPSICIDSRFCIVKISDSCGFWWLPLVEQEHLTLPEHMNSCPVFSRVLAWSLILCVVFLKKLFVLLSLFLWQLCLSVLLRFTDSDYPLWYLQTFLISNIFNTLSKFVLCMYYVWNILLIIKNNWSKYIYVERELSKLCYVCHSWE